MAVTYGFFNSVNGDRKYNAEQMSEYFRGIINEGVYQHLDGGLAVTAGTGLAVNVAAGRAIIQNRWVQNSAAMSLTIAAASETYARKDAVVIRLNWSSRSISIVVKTGTPAASPVAPSMTRNSTTYEMALAYVNVAANATSVTVTDKRSDSTVCGWVTVAQSTSGEVDAQLNAMKTGFDGVTYASPAAMVQGEDQKIYDAIYSNGMYTSAWSDGWINSSGTYVYNNLYLLSDNYIPVNLIKRIIWTTSSSTYTINMNFYDKDKNHICLKSFCAGGGTIETLPRIHNYVYCRIWVAKAGITDINSAVKIIFGNPDGIGWGYGFVNSSGQYNENTNYVLSDYVPINTIKKVVSTKAFIINVYAKDKTTVLYYSSFDAGTHTMPYKETINSNNADAFVKFWFSESDITNVNSDIYIEYGDGTDINNKVEMLNNLHTILKHEWIGSDGVVHYSLDYTCTSFIPIGLIKSITPRNGKTVSVVRYTDDFSFISYMSITTKTYLTISEGDAYVKIWLPTTNFASFDDDVYIEYGILQESENEIAMPAKEYMLSGTEYDLFPYNIVKVKDDDIVRIDPTSPGTTVRNTGDAVRIANPANIPYGTVVSKIISKYDNRTKESKSSFVVTSTPSYDYGTTYVQVIGDSFTAMSPSWIDYIFSESLCPGVQFVGLRKNKTYNTQYHEGRGGWGWSKYAQPTVGNGLDGNCYAGFWQPNGNYKYWGDVRFWVNTRKASTDREKYLYGGFDASKFDSSGYLLNPTTNDIMYDSRGFIIWNGSEWTTTSESSYTWGFDYAKYLSMWNITPPSVCVVMLGMNDFRYSFTINGWNSYKTNMDAFISSYKSAVPGGKFIVAIHCTDTGRNWNDGETMNISAESQNLNLWKYRKALIDEYDGRESEGI